MSTTIHVGKSKVWTIAALLLMASSARAQVSLQPGQSAICLAGATATATSTPQPTSTPTPVPTQAFQNIFMPQPPLSPGSTLWPYWIVQPAKPDGSSALVAFVNVTINGVQQPSWKGGGTGHTYDYRLGGQPIPGVNVANGTFNWNVGAAGTYNFVFNAFNDAGQLVQSVPEQAIVQ